ncbi:hypothetical protein LP417_03530 [Polaromonas sp. P1-6]|nr:hypothetical protein LP417_03530 [Polaromonas sp. P1-6]
MEGFERDELVTKFRSAFHAGKRLASLLCADGLIAQGVPPTFWHSHLSRSDFNLVQRFDLFAYDVRWLRSAYPSHALTVRYRRCRLLLTGTERNFWHEAEFSFYAGRRPAWKIVGSLSLDERQQTDCQWLRSAPVARRLQAVTARRDRVFAALQEDLRGVRRIATFTDDDAKALLLRRHRLWLCGQMAGGKPSETAQRYRQMTGEIIGRALAANHLRKVDEVLRKTEVTSRPEREMT